MKISYDSQADALYIRLLEGKYECRTLQLNDFVSFNIGEGEALVGVEILDASKVLKLNIPATIELQNLLAKTG